MQLAQQDRETVNKILRLSAEMGIDVTNSRLRRTSSRFCFGVEHGDYNGTELFGAGTDRWLSEPPEGWPLQWQQINWLTRP